MDIDRDRNHEHHNFNEDHEDINDYFDNNVPDERPVSLFGGYVSWPPGPHQTQRDPSSDHHSLHIHT